MLVNKNLVNSAVLKTLMWIKFYLILNKYVFKDIIRTLLKKKSEFTFLEVNQQTYVNNNYYCDS